ncbi:MAG TPA: protein kinase [Bryobacteraceae bacterium]|jgi:tetratricopeptide (TPR) repeat protein|nr:protein kinase [Bryobacteraceae bacterium]
MNQWVGRRVGPYRIQKLLGRGGMGAVFLAVRDDDQFRKSVALKLLRFDTDDPALLARFRNERQILAALDHANIAALYDGGSTDEGLPYIVMEYVAGEMLTAYCQSRNLAIPDRLRIFCKVCDAVQYAHQKLIVHRDLKPSNILVTHEGVPKLLDFGIAKLLLAPEFLSEGAPQTKTGHFAMTPDYASPEQVRGEAVTTLTDVYSLGAVLYEVLTGERPHRLTRYDLKELETEICNSDPKAPSAVGGTALKGDLDTIVLKAMHREPARRYRSVEQFSEDILRHLQHRPVLARPDTLSYRVSRFAARNRWGIAAAAAIALSLSAGTLVALSEARVAQQRFQQVRTLAGRFIELHDDVARLPGSTKVREKMVATALDYLDSLSRSAGRDAELLHEIGDAYEKVAAAQGAPGQPNLGRTDDALASFRKAIEFDRRAASLNPAYRPRLADVESQSAYISMLSGHLPDARRNLDAAASLLKQLRAEKPEDLDVLSLAASVALHQGDLSDYEGHSRDKLAFWQQARQFTADVAQIKQDNASRARLHLITDLVAVALDGDQRYDEAIAVLHEGEPLIDSLLAAEPDNPLYLRQKMSEANYLGEVYDDETGKSLNKPVEAAVAGRRYVALAERLAGADSNNASARLSMAIAYYRLSYPLGKIAPEESLVFARKAVQVFDTDLLRRPNDRLLRSRRARALRYLAYAFESNRRRGEARAAAAEAVGIQRQLLAEMPADTSEVEQIALTSQVLARLSDG